MHAKSLAEKKSTPRNKEKLEQHSLMVKIESTKERGEKNMMEKFSFSLASTM
jgi:hypothetical protein